jgi:aspartyl aminopeptidase
MSQDESKDSGKSELEEKLAFKSEFTWTKFTGEQKDQTKAFSREYLAFLREARTERERTAFAEKLAVEKGFRRIDFGSDSETTVQPGDKVYYINRGKNIALFVIGEAPMTSGVHFIGAHVDFPRIDLKIRPLYEEGKAGLALLKTHYYGGLKKYLYATVPLALTGVVSRADGTIVNVEVGLDPEDPVFTIPDLLIHLAKNIQYDRKTPDVIKAEEMNAVAGSIQSDDDKAKERFKINVLSILNEKYGITEADFYSAELTLVPAYEPRYVGFDKGLIGAAGQDDGSCAYLALRAILDLGIDIPALTVGTGLFDKEETGSNGATGAQSAWIRQVFADLAVRTGVKDSTTAINAVYSNVSMLSADVSAGFDPSFPSVHDPQVAAVMGKGVVLERHSGSNGKYNTSEATAEYTGYVRRLFDAANVPYQFGTLGQVDAGGGGTIAMFFAQALNCNVIDCGVPIINMHSPFELSHIADIFAGYLAYKAFFAAQ